MQINYTKSDMFPITYVVPQISTPGPLLYLLYKNTKKTSFRRFSNDTNVFYVAKTVTTLKRLGMKYSN